MLNLLLSQAPLLELHRASDSSLNQKKYPYSVPAEIDLSGHTITGTAYFDLEPEFPCKCLILAPEHALILRPGAAVDEGSYSRIGTVRLSGS